MAEQDRFELYCHVGLGKTGTTYLQYEFFPKLKGVKYIQRTQYKKFGRIIARTHYSKYFVSREFDRQFEREVPRIAEKYPSAGIIIVLRRNDSWIASQYRRHVKNGGQHSFQEFLDLKHDQGLWKQKDVYFYPKLLMLKDLFTKKPLVLFHDELKKEPFSFFDKIADYLGVTYDKRKINVNPKHKSYNDKQLRYIRSVSSGIFRPERRKTRNRLHRWIQFRSRWLLCRLFLLLGQILPEKFVDNTPVIEQELLEEVREFYAHDWEKCKEFAGEHSYISQGATDPE